MVYIHIIVNNLHSTFETLCHRRGLSLYTYFTAILIILQYFISIPLDERERLLKNKVIVD